MNIPDPIKLPSGRYRIQIQVDGVRYGQTFDTPEEAVYWAVGLKTKCKESKKPARRMTVNEAMSAYIEMREPVLSPATISGYRRIQKNLLPPIAGKLLPDLSQDNIQRWVNQMVKSGKTEKTIANAHGLLSAVLTHFSPDTRLTTPAATRKKRNPGPYKSRDKVYRRCLPGNAVRIAHHAGHLAGPAQVGDQRPAVE